MDYRKLFDLDIDIAFKTSAKLLAEYPKSALSLAKVMKHEAKAKERREKWYDEGVCVPPLLIVSTTDNCNLRCKECYSMCCDRKKANELPGARIKTLLNEVSDAGCSTVLLAGGEPLMSPEWILSVAEHKELLGLVFTNGTLFDESWVDFFNRERNVLPLFSIEGSPARTDDRRGDGVTAKIKAVMSELSAKKIPFGISVTTGSHNISEVTSGDFADEYIRRGCRLIIHVEYVPMSENEYFLPLTKEEKSRLAEHCDKKNRENEAVYIVFPGNEEVYGGCLAAGRGFVHIAASGLLEPCPFAPYSDRNVDNTSFIEALKSPLLKVLRDEAHMMHEGAGGCSLRSKESWLKKILENETV